jgi:TetR/AcrR family transcriptional repressor of nem operon
MAGPQGRDTASAILDAAERLVQSRGFNGFSYADVAAELQVTKPALHYHFAGKGELGEALLARYSRRFGEALERIEAEVIEAPARLQAYADLYAGVLDGRLMCLCGMLAAEFETLPAPMQDAVRLFFDDHERWIARVLEQGRDDGTLRFDDPAIDRARLIVSGLEGAMLVARSYGDPERFRTAARTLLAGLGIAAPTPARPRPR